MAATETQKGENLLPALFQKLIALLTSPSAQSLHADLAELDARLREEQTAIAAQAETASQVMAQVVEGFANLNEQTGTSGTTLETAGKSVAETALGTGPPGPAFDNCGPGGSGGPGKGGKFGLPAKIGAGVVAVGGLMAIAGNAFAAAGAALTTVNRESLSGFFSGIFDSVSQTISVFVNEAPGLLPGWLKEPLGSEKSGGSGAGAEISAAGLDGSEGADVVLSPDAAGNVAAFLDSAGRAVRDFGSFFVDGAGSFLSDLFGGDASASVSPALAAAGPVDNGSVTTLNGGIQVYTRATDAQGIARDIGRSVENAMTATANSSNGF
jgi:hypothetical protein